MEENYYDILEVNQNASQEVIEKAYKTLVKKYHPDVQNNNLKNNYEEKIKKINEAYEVLSNPEKKYNYDLNLKNNYTKINNYNNLINENINLKNEINYLKNNLNKNSQNIKNKEFKINYQKISKDLIALILTIIFILILIFILLKIPFTKNYLISFYNNNPILKIIVDFFISIFK